MNNVAETVEVALSLFGGLDTELSPSDLPQGLSPANLNCAFVPGAVFTRPPLVQASAIPAAGQIIYATSFVSMTGEEVVLQFGSNGGIYANGVQVGATKAGNRFKVSSLFGRAYIAISDGDHGADIPLQYDPVFGLSRVSQDGPGAGPTLTNYAIASSGTSSLTRAAGVVTAVTSTPHGLNPGNQFALTGVGYSATGGAIVSIAISPESLPDIATVTMSTAHGLVPDVPVVISGVPNTMVGGGIATSSGYGEVVTFVTNAAHGLSAGETVVIKGVGYADGAWPVVSVIDSLTFTIQIPGQNLLATNGTGGTVALVFPNSTADDVTTFTVQAVPTPTTFQIALGLGSGTWAGGSVKYLWDGTYYVTGVSSPTSFTYAQSGPSVASTAEGTITPQGQISPGVHQCVLLFLTQTGYLTKPSPPIQFTADGNSYIQVTNCPKGPANVVARYLAFTGANGANYFVLPVPAQLNGLPLSTSTILNDNVSTSAILDFSDNALFNGLAIDIEGNNTFRQVVLGPCLGFYPYAGRLFAWGERNKVQQFLNMGFEGGTVTPNTPLGWTLTGTGTLVAGANYGVAWQPNSGATISQPAFEDYTGAPILTGNTQYTFRAFVNGTVNASIVSASRGVLGTASITAVNAYAEALFTAKTPAAIPSDASIEFSGGLMDELEIYYTNNPYIQFARASYVNNPEAFDGVTGQIGPLNDPNALRTMYVRRNTLHLLTDGPEGSLYETQDSASAEPANWNVEMVATKCGAISVWGDAQFEDWQVWASDTGVRIFDGATVEKMSQEVQSWWSTINPAARNLTVLANDPYLRRIYVLAAIGSSSATNATYVLDYRELNTAQAMSNSTPLKVSFTGRMLTTDLTRKWSPWSITANYCGMIGNGKSAVMTFCGGGNLELGATYTLNEGSLSGYDADYGAFQSFYASYYLVSGDEAQQLKLQMHRKLFGPVHLNVWGQGAITITPLLNNGSNPGRTSRPVKLPAQPNFDLLFPGEAQGDRVAFMVTAQPATPPPIGPADLQAGFYLSGMTVALKDHPYSVLRGSNQ